MASALVAGLVFTATALHAGGEYLIQDLGQVRMPPLSEALRSEDHAVLDGIAYFYRDDGRHGLELWRSDGTALGTYFLRDLCPGVCGSDSFGQFAIEEAGGLVFFSGNDGIHGSELWVTDGTSAGTRRVSDIAPGPKPSVPSNLEAGSGRVYFTAGTVRTEHGIWVSDGTLSGTRPLFEVGTDPFEDWIEGLRFVDGLLYVVTHGSLGSLLWRTDGTSAGTFVVHPYFGPHEPVGLAAMLEVLPDGALLFQGCSGEFNDDCELWKTDGTVAGTVRVADLRPGSQSSDPQGLHRVGAEIWFQARAGSGSIDRLFRTDGTSAGTFEIPLPPGLRVITRGTLAKQLGAGLLVVGCEPATGCEPWLAEAGGATPLGDLVSGPASSIDVDWYQQPSFTGVGGSVLFLAEDASGSARLWRTDGSAAGTSLLSDLGSPPTDAYFGWVPARMPSIVASERWVFHLFRGDRGVEIWSSDGTSTGTGRIGTVAEQASAFLAPVLNMYTPSRRACAAALRQGLVAKAAGMSSMTSSHLVFSDGVPGEVQVLLLADEFSYGRSVECEPIDSEVLATVPNELDSTVEVWRTRGAASSTQLLLPAFAGFRSSPALFPHRGGLAFLEAITDPPETTSIRLVPRGANGPGDLPELASDLGWGELVSTGEHLFHVDSNGGLAVTDGASDAVLLVEPPSVPPFDHGARDGVAAGDMLYFVHDLPEEGPELWRSDGSVAGTFSVRNLVTGPAGGFERPYSGEAWNLPAERRLIALSGGRIVFAGSDNTTGFELWTSDGTEAGTEVVADIAPGPDSSWPRHLVSLGNGVELFAAEHPKLGYELFRTDGTAAGTSMVRDLVVGPGSSVPDEFVVQDGVLYFSAWTPSHGREAWRSDGTFAGTYRLTDIAPGPLSSSPSRFVRRGNRLFFTATDHVHGFELWARADDGSVPLFIDGFETEDSSRWSAIQP